MSKAFSIFGSGSRPQLGPFERKLLQELWSHGSATVRELLADGKIHQAYTTVMTTVDRLYKKGLLDRVAEGRAFRYTPRHTPEELQRVTALESIQQLLGSADASSLPLSYLVEALSTHDAQLLDELQLLVERKRRELQSRENKGSAKYGAGAALMFALRGIAVSLTFFVLVYCLLSALVAVAWRSLKLLRAAEQRVAGLLFALRILPLMTSVVITCAFVVPSFQLLEPRSIHEGMGTMPLTLGVCALLLIACGCYRVITAQIKTSRAVARWLEGADPLPVDSDPQMVTFRAKRGAPPLTLVGVRRPRVLVSESTVALLSHDELRVALQHERAHMRSRDNLKKLVFRFCPFPGMARLESAWSQAAELAADDAAVSNLNDAVDLAAALVKVVAPGSRGSRSRLYRGLRDRIRQRASGASACMGGSLQELHRREVDRGTRLPRCS